MKKTSQKLGKEAELLAQKYLQENGYRILECNWRYRKYEIDVIGQKQETVVFFEVKARSTDAFGEPELFVTRKKQNFLIAAASHYLKENDIRNESRFDIIAILPKGNNYSVKHMEAAFYPLAK